MKHLACCVAALFCVAMLGSATAQGYPSKPVRIVMPFPPGGPTDVISRATAQRLTAVLGQPVVVENRPGANTIIGGEMVAKAVPDGHTLLFTVNATVSINPLVYSKLPYSAADFTPVTLVANLTVFLMVNGDLPANSLQEFVQAAKSQPGKFNYASYGLGSNGHLEAEAFKAATGTDIVHVPFKGAAEAIPAMLAGQVHLIFSSASAGMQHIKTGRIRALAAQSTERSALLPNVPTFAESGLAGFDTKAWFGFLAPAKTPQDIVRRLAGEIAKIVNTPEFREKYILGYLLDAAPAGPEAMAEVMVRERENYARTVKAANIKLD